MAKKEKAAALDGDEKPAGKSKLKLIIIIVVVVPQQPLTQEAEKHPEAESEKPETPPAEPAEPISPVAGNVIDFIAASGSKGRSLNEIKRRFPELAQNLRAALNAEVAAGRLSMAGARYRNPT